jgi:hypothetical protein
MYFLNLNPDALNTGEELVSVPVCTQLRFYEFLSRISSDKLSDLNRPFDSTYILGKL